MQSGQDSGGGLRKKRTGAELQFVRLMYMAAVHKSSSEPDIDTALGAHLFLLSSFFGCFRSPTLTFIECTAMVGRGVGGRISPTGGA